MVEVTMFKVGDKVKWKSQAGGNWTEKLGEVIQVVPAGLLPDHPQGGARPNKLQSWKPRSMISYLIRIPGKSGRGQSCYWPVAFRLEPQGIGEDSQSPPESET